MATCSATGGWKVTDAFLLSLDKMIETIFLDAGGVLVNPNWDRVAAALGG